jgi:hypothetical protein
MPRSVEEAEGEAVGRKAATLADTVREHGNGLGYIRT